MAEDHPGPLRCAGQRTAGALLVRRRAGFEAGGVEDGGAHALHPRPVAAPPGAVPQRRSGREKAAQLDRKSTRLNSSHVAISYAVFCLKKIKSILEVECVLYL